MISELEQRKSKELKEALTILDNLMKTKRPIFHSYLNGKVESGVLTTFKNRYKVALPLELKTLYNWHNGQIQEKYGAFVFDYKFIPLKLAMEHEFEEEQIKVAPDLYLDLNTQFIPIFRNDQASYLLYDIFGSLSKYEFQILEFNVATNKIQIIAENLTQIIFKLNEYYSEYQKISVHNTFSIHLSSRCLN